MRSFAALILAFISIGLAGCLGQPGSPAVTGSSSATFSLEGIVLRVDRDLVTMQVHKPGFDDQGRLALKLAGGIIADTYLIEGRSVHTASGNMVIERVAGEDILARVSGNSPAPVAGDRIRIYLDRKTIAITDLKVINSKIPEIARYVQEELTTALVRSGQFRVLEREQLGTLLKEISLSQSGLVDRSSAKKAGQLLGADLILTGSMTRTGDIWSANLRLINTESGLVLTAVNRSGRLAEVREEQIRDAADIHATFETGNNSSGWILGEKHGGRAGQKGFQKVSVEKGGADMSAHSLAMEFVLGKVRTDRYQNRKMFVTIRNAKKRDLSLFTGIRFSIRATAPTTVMFVMSDSQKGNPNEEKWWKNFEVGTNWQKVVIPFQELSLGREKARRLGTDGIFDPGRIEKIDWQINESRCPPGTSGTIQLDAVSFY